MAVPTDRVLRALTRDNSFRVMVAVTTHTAQGAIAAQGATGPTALRFAELLTGAVLVRETMSPFYRVQALLSGVGGKGRLLGDSSPDGSTRGLVALTPGADTFETGPGSQLQVMRTLASGQTARGIVDVAAATSVAQAVMVYLQDSEQIVSVVGIGSSPGPDGVELAGGYLVQLLPDANRGALKTMTERLTGLADATELLRSAGGDAQGLLDAVLRDVAYDPLGDESLSFHCWCTPEAVLAAIATLGHEEIATLMQEDEAIELSCDYCRKSYRVARSQLAGLLEQS